MFDAFDIVLRNSAFLLMGLELTLRLAGVTILFGTVLGLFGGLGVAYGPLPLRLAIRGYIDLLRGLPLLVTIFVIFYGLPLILGLDIDPFASVAIALSAFAAAHVSEIVRGAVQSIHRTQMDAAKSIGLGFWTRMQFVILPQAFRRALPPWMNLAADLIKGSSLASLVSLSDLMLVSNHLVASTQALIPFYTAAGVIYFVLCFGLSRSAAILERSPKWLA